jgi:hypothetical protein
MMTDSNRPRFTRPLTAMMIAIALAATATLTGAAGALGKAPPVVEVDGFECATLKGSATGAAGANVVTTAKGRWWYLDYWTTTTDSTGATSDRGSEEAPISVKMDAKNPTAVYGSSGNLVAPATTTFYLRLMDRHGAVLHQPTPETKTCL